MKFQKGDRVKIISCDSYDGLNCDCIGKTSIIVDVNSDDDYPYTLKNVSGHPYSIYLETELELIKNSQPYMRKKYVLLKDTPDVKKGGIFEEMCDDGTQDFKLITPEHEKFANKTYESVFGREVVTNNPKWFAEVTVMYVLKSKVQEFKKSLKSAVKKKKK